MKACHESITPQSNKLRVGLITHRKTLIVGWLYIINNINNMALNIIIDELILDMYLFAQTTNSQIQPPKKSCML